MIKVGGQYLMVLLLYEILVFTLLLEHYSAPWWFKSVTVLSTVMKSV